MIKVSESLHGAIENFLEVTPAVSEHMANKENPHAVTKEQVGLSNVINEKQATEAQYNAHINGNVKHSAGDILYADNLNLEEKIKKMEAVCNGGSEVEELRGEIEGVKSEIEGIKGELGGESIILTGEIETDTFDSTIHIPVYGDPRFIGRNGGVTVPEGYAGVFEVTVTTVVKEGDGAGFSKSFFFYGACMNYQGEPVFALSDGGTNCDKEIMLPVMEGVYNYYSAAMFMDYSSGYGPYVIGDDAVMKWKATIEFKNLVHI